MHSFIFPIVCVCVQLYHTQCMWGQVYLSPQHIAPAYTVSTHLYHHTLNCQYIFVCCVIQRCVCNWVTKITNIGRGGVE